MQNIAPPLYPPDTVRFHPKVKLERVASGAAKPYIPSPHLPTPGPAIRQPSARACKANRQLVPWTRYETSLPVEPCQFLSIQAPDRTLAWPTTSRSGSTMWTSWKVITPIPFGSCQVSPCVNGTSKLRSAKYFAKAAVSGGLRTIFEWPSSSTIRVTCAR